MDPYVPLPDSVFSRLVVEDILDCDRWTSRLPQEAGCPPLRMISGHHEAHGKLMVLVKCLSDFKLVK
jgi:hypothetical protein